MLKLRAIWSRLRGDDREKAAQRRGFSGRQLIPENILRAIEQHLHAVIRVRASELIDKNSLPLPSLAAMAAGQMTDLFRPSADSKDQWLFLVPGMYGGFKLRWIAGGPDAVLEVESFCRVVGGSGERHHITAVGSKLVESGLY